LKHVFLDKFVGIWFQILQIKWDYINIFYIMLFQIHIRCNCTEYLITIYDATWVAFYTYLSLMFSSTTATLH
jgi:hypothetical protein